MNSQGENGFTLLELLLVLGLIGLMAALTAPYMASTLNRMELDSEARKIASALNYSRNEAIARKIPLAFNGDLSENRYWLSSSQAVRPIKRWLMDDSIQMTEFSNLEESQSEGTFVILFYPLGNTSGGSIRVEPTDPGQSEIYYAIDLDLITGVPTIESIPR